MVVTRKSSAPMPVASRSNTSRTKPPQLKDSPLKPSLSVEDQNALGLELLLQGGSMPDASNHVGPPQFSDTSKFVRPSPDKQQVGSKKEFLKPKGKAKGKKGSHTNEHHFPDASASRHKRSSGSSSSFFEYLAWLTILAFGAYAFTVCPNDNKLDHAVCRMIDSVQPAFVTPFFRSRVQSVLNHPYVASNVERVAPYYKHAVDTTQPLAKSAGRVWSREVVPRTSAAWEEAMRQVDPLVRRAGIEYQWRVAPHVRNAQRSFKPYKRQLERLALNGLRQSHYAWRRAEPYAQEAWAYLAEVPRLFNEYIITPLHWAWAQWGDPQVRRMWARVEELAAGKPKAKRMHKATVVPGAYAYSQGFAAASDRAADHTDEEEQIVETGESEPSVDPDMFETATAEPDPGSSLTFMPEATDATAASAASIAHASVSPEPLNPEAEEIDDFLRDLMMEDPELDPAYTQVKATETPASPPPASSSQSQAPPKRPPVDVKAKRASIEQAQAEWEEKLVTAGQEVTDAFVERLLAFRHEQVELLKASDGPATAMVQGFEDDLNKYLKSMTSYLKKLQVEAKPNEGPQLWQRLVDKIHTLVEQHVTKLETMVDEHWKGLQVYETAMIDESFGAIHAVAESGQSALSSRWAWLEDVTHKDWARFHGLVKTAKEFRQVCQDMQEGSHPKSPADAVEAFFKRMQADVENILVGFQAQFDELTRLGQESFSHPRTGVPEGQATILPVGGGSDPQVVIGRGKEEVREAIQRSEKHEEL